jgi:DNA polymerase I-like protein with 3'-5' exonuclease and polymerase domains
MITIEQIRAKAKKLETRLLEQKKLPDVVCIDFETDGIESRPYYPPKPCGVSIKYPGKAPRYYGFGHVGSEAENNCTEAEARAALKKAYKYGDGVLCQNAKFDIDVAETHWKLKRPAWNRIHDTMFLIFLDDPNQQSFSLKPASERLLGMPPEEKDAVGEWLLKHQPVEGVKISASQRSPTYFMKYLRYAPAPLVGKYANGDVIRTERLFKLLWPKSKARGMLLAYERERRLMPNLLEMEQVGVPVDLDLLEKDITKFTSWQHKVDAWLRKRLKCGEEVNLDSSDQLFAAMLKAKVVDRSKALMTPTGKFQTNKDALLVAVKDKALLGVLKYRSQLKTCLGTFMRPWAEVARVAKQFDGTARIFTTWNQVKGDARGGNVGARTGRLSSTPNFQNLPKVFEAIFFEDLPRAKRNGSKLPRVPDALRGLPRLPWVRRYVVPFKGDVLIDRDYSQQEPRILAHFDGGELMLRYQAEPWIDFHDFAKLELEKVGLFYERKPVKIVNLGLIYGQGVGTLAEALGLPVEEAKTLKNAILRLYSGLKQMYRDAKQRAANNEPVRTWGGREYFCEPPKVIDGRIRTFDYKLVNVLIQGSAADCTKEAIIRYFEHKRSDDKLLLNTHDQLTASVHSSGWTHSMELLRRCMESVEFDVPMLSEGSMSFDSWGKLEDTDKKGVPV